VPFSNWVSIAAFVRAIILVVIVSPCYSGDKIYFLWWVRLRPVWCHFKLLRALSLGLEIVKILCILVWTILGQKNVLV
jgi:hypothetical protein